MSTPIASLDELHQLIRDGQVGQDEALRLIQDWQNGQAGSAADAPVVETPAVEAPAVDQEALADRVREVVVEKICGLLKVDAAELEVDVELSEYGLDSIVISQLVNMLNESLGLELAPTVIFEHPTLRAFGDYLATDFGPALSDRFGLRPQPPKTAPQPPRAVPRPRPETPEPAAATREPPRAQPEPPSEPVPAPSAPATGRTGEPVAIVGISGRFPQAEDLDAFWRNLREGRDCVAEIPADRWDWRAYQGDPRREPGRTSVKWGGFIDGVADFDPLFFGIAPRDAVHMDPQQRLLMLTVWQALEDAGYSADEIAGSDLGLFVGTNDTGYGLLAERCGGNGGSVSPTGSVPSVGPNRMSYFLDVHGPSEPVETACSSSLVAMHRGVAALERGECDMAVVGGVNTIVVPDGHIAFDRSGMLSQDGRCKTFSAEADGYVRGEGVGMLVLKRLSAAERDGDHIHGLIRSTVVNHGGRSTSLTAPNPKAQAALISQAYRRAGIDPRTVGYVEAHGTGTNLGDPIEINGLKAAFEELYAERGAEIDGVHCGLGSVKTNIGHLELAAGVAGVLKVLLQLRHRTLAKTLHCENVNPYIDLDGSPFHLVRESQPWPAPVDADGRELPRRAGVSSFGFGGVNAHIVLEEYVPAGEPPAATGEPVAVLLSASEPETLRTRARQLADWIDAGRVSEDDLPRLGYTLQVGRVAMTERLALLTTSLADLRDRLRSFVDDGRAPGVHTGHVDRKGPWSELAHDEDIAAALDNWVAKGKLGRLLKLWVTGLDVDWRRLHGSRPPRRLPLPAYSFNLRRFWITDGRDQQRPAGAPEHRRELSGQEYFLRDHRVRDVPTLPGVAYLEFVREALGRADGVRLRDVTWLRPLEVTGPRRVGVDLDTAGQTFEVYAEQDGERVVHARGGALVRPAEAETHDVDSLLAGCSGERSGVECYSLFERMGMGYGPALRGIETLHYGPDLALARLVLPEAAESGLTLNPSILDSALQASLGLVLAENDGEPGEAALPFVVREVQVLAATPERGWALVRRSADDRPGSGVRRLDIDVCDEGGEVRVRLLGFSARTRQAAKAAPDTALLVRPGWRQSEAPAAPRETTSRHVVACELPGLDAAALGETGENWQAEGDIARRYTAYGERLLELLRREAGSARAIQLLTPAAAPWLGGLSGLLRTARVEHPKLRTQWIELDEVPPAAELAGLLARDAADTAEQVVRYRAGQREVSRWSEITGSAPERPWRDDGVYLITGGAGGLGVLFAEDIARRVSTPTLVLCGRSPAGADQDEACRRLGELGATANYRALDVADHDEVVRAVREIRAEHGALHGIVHAAGVLRDGFLARKSAADLRTVFAAKVDGLRNLDEASAELPLDCFIAFSSMAAYGNNGQADYAAANAFLDGYAVHREALVARGERHGRTLSVNWPLWERGGMGATAATVTLLESVGMRPMRAAVGIDALDRAWATRLPVVIALDGRHDRMRAQFLPATEPVAKPVAKPVAEPVARPVSKPEPVSEPAAANGTDLANVAAGLMAALLDIEAPALPWDEPLRDYGFDSIFMMQFLTQAQEHIDDTLTLDVIADCDTLRDVTEAIGAAIGAPATAPAAPAAQPEPIAEPEPEPVAPVVATPREPVSPGTFPELVKMNGVTTGRPVFWVHHGNGGVESYASLAARCPRPFYGIQPKGWIDGTDILTGQRAMGAHYADVISAVQPEGPYDLGGFSLGGLFAYETVRQLQLRGSEVTSLVMLDTLDATATNRANALIVGGDFSAEAVAKVSAFRAVNLILGNDRFDSHGGATPILRRDEVDPTLGVPEFLDSLIAEALARGVPKTEGQLRRRVAHLARYLEATQGDRYTVDDLPHPDRLRCYYLRNSGGDFFGAFREHMVLFSNPDLPEVDGSQYWREWTEHIDDFFTIDVDTTMHAEVMTAPDSLDKLMRLADRLYAAEDSKGGR